MKLMRLIAIGCVALLTACSSAPSNSTMAKLIERSINQQAKTNYVKVSHLKKTNVSKEKGVYSAYLKYDVDYTKNSDQVFPSAGYPPGFMKMMHGTFKAGDVKHEQGQFVFIKSDKGWAIEVGS